MNTRIIYPAPFEPSVCPVFIRNEIDINASPEKFGTGLQTQLRGRIGM